MKNRTKAISIALEMARAKLDEYARAIPYDVTESGEHKRLIQLINNTIDMVEDKCPTNT